MITTHHIEMPLTEEAVRKLRAGDQVLISGEIVISAGMPTYQRMIEFLDAGKPLPLDMSGAALFHLGSYSREVDGKMEVVYMNPTTSTRFNGFMPRLIRSLGLRAVGGKGGLDAESVRAMQEAGCVYLSFLGGGCTLLSESIRELVSVDWKDLLMHYRLVKLRVEGLPATVGIDAHGNSLYGSLMTEARDRLPAIMEKLKARRHEPA